MTDKDKEVLKEWLKFSEDVQPSCAAGDDWLDDLRRRTQHIIDTQEPKLEFNPGMSIPLTDKQFKELKNMNCTCPKVSLEDIETFLIKELDADIRDSIDLRELSILIKYFIEKGSK